MDEDLSTTLLRDRLDEELHQLEHLQRSQDELAEELLKHSSCPDSDLKDAVEDNKVVILEKEKRIIGIHESLMKKDAAYRKEKHTRASLSRLLNSASLVVGAASTGGVASTVDDGFYL